MSSPSAHSEPRPAPRPRPFAGLAAFAFVLCLIALGILGRRRPNDHPHSGTLIRRNATPRMIMGALVHISAVSATKTPEQIDLAIEHALAWITELDHRMSPYRPDSEISQANEQRKGTVSAETYAVLKRAMEISALTQGAFDVTVQPILRVWKDAEKANRLPSEEAMKNALALVGYKEVCLKDETRDVLLPKKGIVINLSGIAQGYGADAAAEVLRKDGIENFMVEIGGEVYCQGRRDETTPWRIGVQDPRSDPGEQRLLDIILGLSDMAVSTSGNYQQFVTIEGRRFSHIVDPRTGRPADEAPGVTIIAPECAAADALATAVSVMGVEKGLALIESLPRTEALLITLRDGRLEFHKTTGFDRYVLETRAK